jgi:hypothetical protein
MKRMMGQANLVTLRLLAVGLFIGGIVSTGLPSLSLGLILAAVVISCTALVVTEIREAKREIIEKLRKQQPPLCSKRASG